MTTTCSTDTNASLLRAGVGAVALCILLLSGSGASGADTAVLGRPAYLVIESARDTTAGFRWDHDAKGGRRSLRWVEGVLDIPDTLRPVAFGPRDLGILLGPECRGTGAAGSLQFVDGVYRVTELLALDDGRTRLHLSAGVLDIRGDQIRYRRLPAKPARDPRAGYLMLAGMVLLVTVLLRRARQRR